VGQKAFFVDENELLSQKQNSSTKKQPKRMAAAKGKSKSSTKIYDCETCGLYKGCRSPKINYRGRGELGIMFIGIGPGREEDKQGKFFVGDSGVTLQEIMDEFDLNISRDCYLHNLVACRTPDNRLPAEDEIKACKSRLLKDIQEIKPKMIITLGKEPTKFLFKQCGIATEGISTVHGMVFPIHKFNCWLGCTYHPAAIVRDETSDYVKVVGRRSIVINDIEQTLDYLDKPLPKFFDRENCHLITDSNECVRVLRDMTNTDKPTAFDYETTCISAFEEDAQILTVALCDDISHSFCIPLGMNNWNTVETAYVYDALKRFLESRTPKIVQNVNMEETWSRVHVGASIYKLSCDTMIRHHVVWCRRGTADLDFQTHILTGDNYKNMVNKKKVKSEPIAKVAIYNGLDARYTLHSSNVNYASMDKKLLAFENLLLRGAQVMAELKMRGVLVDKKVLNNLKFEAENELSELNNSIARTKAAKRFKKIRGSDINLQSNPQINDLLFDMYKCEGIKKTKTGFSVDAGVIEKMIATCKDPEVVDFLSTFANVKKTDSFLTKIEGFIKHICLDGKIHPSYHLDVAETFRSASSDPNFQNVPKHDELLKLIRECIIPSPGNVLLEVDYDGLEVRGIAMNSNDRNLIAQIKGGDSSDTHRLWASRIFGVPFDKVTGEQRFLAKNKFVFPSFYGAIVASISRGLKMDERKIEKLWNQFWQEYSDVRKWQKRSLAFYEKYGYIRGLSGYKRYGPLSVEQINNTPVQGISFHLMLDALIRINESLTGKLANKFRARPIIQIHDSITFDTPMEEVEDLKEYVTGVMVSKRFDWQLDVPLSVSWEVGENWLEMEKLKL
jgi:uracil-DNA glycosylase family 4